MTRRARSSDLAGGSWFVSIALALVLLAATLLLRPAFTTAHWTMDAAVVVFAAVGAAALVRAVIDSVFLPAAAGVLATIVVLTVRQHPGSIAEVFGAWGETVVQLVTQLSSDAPPFRETPESVTAALIVVAFVTILCDLFVFGLRGGVSALAPVLVFPAIPIVLGVRDIELWPTLWLAAAFGLYLFAVSWWHQRMADDRLADSGYLVDRRGFSGWLGAGAVGAAGLVVAIVATTVLPAPSGVSWLQPNPGAALSTNRANPILDLGDDLRRDEAVPVLQYATSIEAGRLPYLSLMSLTTLDGGSEWAPGAFDGDVSTDGGAPLPQPAGLSPATPATSYGANIVLEPGVSAYLPQPGRATRVEGLDAPYRFESATGDIRQDSDEALGQHYELTGTMPNVVPDVLGGMRLEVPSALEGATSVPGGAGADAIRGVLDGIVDRSGTPYAQALQVQAFLTSAAFTYSETAPVNGGYDGTNLDVVARFLTEAHSGYCVHFASAMAIMGRMLGIPTRIQVGFTPGTPTAVNEQGQAVYAVTSDDLHAWAELYVPQYGWVPFESTPSSGLGNMVVPDATTEVTVPPTTPPASEAGPTPTPTGDTGASEPAEPSTPPEATQPAETEPGSSADGPGSAWPSWMNLAALAVVLVVFAIALLLLLPAIVRVLVRRRRRARVLGSDEAARQPSPAELAWRELLDEAADHRARVPAGAVPGVQEERLLELASGGAGADAPDRDELTDALERLRRALERSLFDRPDATRPSVDWSDVERVEAGIRHGATRAGRAKAVLAPASLPAWRSLAAALARLPFTRRRRGDEDA